MTSIGKPYEGKLHVRFDEEGLVSPALHSTTRHWHRNELLTASGRKTYYRNRKWAYAQYVLLTIARKGGPAMPNRDGTGPMGQGPMTGRNRGTCGRGRSNKSGILGRRQGNRSGLGNSRGGAGNGGGRGTGNPTGRQGN